MTGRLRGLGTDDLDDDGRALWDDIVSSRGSGVVDADGHLIGPFNPWLRAPAVGRHLQALGAAVRRDTTLDPVVTEIAILTIVGHWHAEFEWQAHAGMARKLGVSESLLDSLRRGETPSFSSDTDRVAHAACDEIVRTGLLEPSVYRTVVETFGERGAVELVSLCGYYTAVAFVVNVFEVLP